MGIEGARRFRRRPAGHRHLPPGQSRTRRPVGVDRQGRRRQRHRLSRHLRRHRQPHDDGQRSWCIGLGRRRDRGRGGDARPADLDADPAGRRFQADRRDGRRHHRDRSRPYRYPDAARPRSRRPLRRIPRTGARRPQPCRPRDHFEHGARIWRDLRLLPGRCQDDRIYAPDRPLGGSDRAGRGLLPRAGHVARGRPRSRKRARFRLHRHARTRHDRRRPQPRRAETPAGQGRADRRR